MLGIERVLRPGREGAGWGWWHDGWAHLLRVKLYHGLLVLLEIVWLAWAVLKRWLGCIHLPGIRKKMSANSKQIIMENIDITL